MGTLLSREARQQGYLAKSGSRLPHSKVLRTRHTLWNILEPRYTRWNILGLRQPAAAFLCTACCAVLSLLPFTLAAQSPLVDAAEKQNSQQIQQLLHQKADPNATQVDGMTALHWAVYHDDFKTTQLLINKGAQPEPKNRYGVTPLYSACQNANPAIVRLLLKAGADANSTFSNGETALKTASRTGNPEVVQLLLKHGAKVNPRGPGQTALMLAAAEGNVEVVKTLLKAGFDPNDKLDSGFSPMLFAIREGRADVVYALLDAGVDINEAADPKSGRLPRGSTPLTLAIENGHFELAASLLELGASPNDMRTRFSPLHILSWVRKPDGGDGPDDLPPPDGSGKISSLQLARILVEKGADINARSKSGQRHWGGGTPFYLAAWKADVPLMKTLVSLGADPKIPASDGSTAFMAATGIGRTMEALSAGTEEEVLAACKYLLELEVDINAVNKSGETAMHGAAYKNLPTVVTFLDQSQANPKIWHQRNRLGSTPYLIAAGYRPGNFKPSYETMAAIKQALDRHGIEPNEKPPKGLDPYAKRQNAANQPIKLFNGWDLEGWTIQNGGRFSVQDGILKVDGGTGWLRSNKTYGDFKLHIEFRFLETGANSGIFVRTGHTSKKDKNGWPDNGYQVQCMDSLKGKPLATMLPYGAPPFEHKSDLQALKKAYKPVREWQTFEITAKGQSLFVKLNGIQVTTATKIKNRKGHIGIQGEHGLLEFRKIELLP